MAAAASAAGSASSSSSSAASGASSVTVVDRSSIDAIKARYRGQGLVNRLKYLAKSDESVSGAALEQAAHVAKSLSANPQQYCALREAAGLSLDSAWVTDVTSKEETQVLNLERDLNMKLAAQDRAGIHLANTELGRYYMSVGETGEAISSFMRAREYCTAEQMEENTILAIRAGVLGSHIDHVLHLARQALGGALSLSSAHQGFVHAAVGIAKLRSGSFETAGTSFLACGSSIGSLFNTIIHSDDVAVAGTLCALAALDRSTCIRRTQSSLDFRKATAGCPDVARLASAFAKGDFGDVVRTLDAMMPVVLRDELLGPRAVQLQTAIVDRIVVDATHPFSRVSIATTAGTICRSPEELMAIAVRLVETGQLPFRVDAAGNALVAKYTDERSSVFAKAMALAATMEGDTKMALLRASLMAGGYKVTISKAEQAAAREAASQAVSLTPREMGGSGYLGRGGTRR